jgi:hypothetical protein
MSNRVIEIDGEFISDFPDLPDSEREYLRLLQLAPWCDADARRFAELRPLADEHNARWEATLAEMCRRPDVVTWQDLAKAEEEREPWWPEYHCLHGKWRRKTPEGAAEEKREREKIGF